MDFASFNTFSAPNNQQSNNNMYSNNKFFDNSFEITKVNNLYCGCFLRNPQELGPKIERPKAPFYTNNRK